MKSILIRMLALAAVSSAAGCAFDGPTATEARAARGEELTGSRVPRKTLSSPAEVGLRVLSPEALEQMQQSTSGGTTGRDPGAAR